MLDVMSGGRASMICCLGHQPEAHVAFQTPQTVRVSRFVETFEIVRRLCAEDAVTYQGKHYAFEGVTISPKPLQQPRPEIVGTVVAPFSKGVVAMGQRDFHPLSANFLLPHWLKTHWANYAEGKQKAGVKPNPGEWRVARTVFVADDDKVAAAYGRHDANSPYRFYYKQLQTKLTKAGRHAVFKERLDQPDEEITYEFVLDRLCIYGTVNKVVDQILALREQVGDFGELVYAGMDWVDPKLARRSMELMATEVMPRVNRALQPNS